MFLIIYYIHDVKTIAYSSTLFFRCWTHFLLVFLTSLLRILRSIITTFYNPYTYTFIPLSTGVRSYGQSDKKSNYQLKDKAYCFLSISFPFLSFHTSALFLPWRRRSWEPPWRPRSRARVRLSANFASTKTAESCFALWKFSRARRPRRAGK